MTSELDIKINILPKSLWESDGMVARSEELTPLYIDRYLGPRHNPSMTSHTFWEMTFVFRGSGLLQTPTVSQTLKPHRACLIPPNILHTELSAEIMDTLWIGIQGNRLNRLSKDYLYVVADTELDECFERLWMRAERPYGPIGTELDGLTQTAFGIFFRLYLENKTTNQNYIDLAVKHINQHYADSINVPWLAEKFGYSEGYFYRTFHQRTGKTPMNYLAEIRINNAIRWLKHSSLNVEKIAHLVGYQDALYFSRVFRKLTGQSPSSIRKK